MLAKIPLKDLQLGEEVTVGTQLRLGNGLTVVVSEKTEDTITIDANPPLAGKTLIFDVELVGLTKARLLKDICCEGSLETCMNTLQDFVVGSWTMTLLWL